VHEGASLERYTGWRPAPWEQSVKDTCCFSLSHFQDGHFEQRRVVPIVGPFRPGRSRYSPKTSRSWSFWR